MNFNRESRQNHRKRTFVFLLQLFNNQNSRLKGIAIHFSFWFFYLLFISFLFSLTGRFVFTAYLINSMLHLPVYLLFTYASLYLIKTKTEKRTGLFSKVVATFLFSFLCSFLIILVNHFLFYNFYLPRAIEPTPWFVWERLFQNLIFLWIPFMLFAVFYYFNNWQQEVIDKKELEKKQLETELQLLKTQLNPHFLLNTLNNLYALAILKSDKIADSILHLADLFRIVLYECRKEKYELTKEIGLIKSYIELMQLRYNRDFQCSFNTTGCIDGWEISPMLLFNFVENCFKHGDRAESGNMVIDIHIACIKDELSFIARNTIPPEYSKKEKGKGIGIENNLKRLEILYKGKYTLEGNPVGDFYVVDLKIRR